MKTTETFEKERKKTISLKFVKQKSKIKRRKLFSKNFAFLRIVFECFPNLTDIFDNRQIINVLSENYIRKFGHNLQKL